VGGNGVILIPLADIMPKRRPPGAKPDAWAEPCLLCGRWLRRVADNVFVEITTDGCIVWPGDGTGASVPNSQGAFPVGPDCYRKIEAAARRATP
jgi:hypothetical protein